MLKLTISDFLFQIETIRMGILPSPYQQLFEINKGIQSLTVTFKGAQRQSEWLEIYLVYNKSCQHLTICDSHDIELATKLIQSIKLEIHPQHIVSLANLNMILKIEMKKVFFIICLLLKIVMVVVQHW